MDISSPTLRIEGNFLVMPTLIGLPERCAWSNEQVSEREYGLWDIPFIPQWLLVLMFTVPLFLFFGPAIAKNRCKFKAGLARRIRRRYLLKKLLAVAIIIGSLLLIPLALTYKPEEFGLVAVLLGLIGFLAGFLILNLFTSPFKVVHYEDGLFWIKGFSSEYLNSLEKA